MIFTGISIDTTLKYELQTSRIAMQLATTDCNGHCQTKSDK